jgi:hypothetical protein
MRGIDRIRLGPQVGEHVMSPARRALVPQRGDIDWRHDDAFTRTG